MSIAASFLQGHDTLMLIGCPTRIQLLDCDSGDDMCDRERKGTPVHLTGHLPGAIPCPRYRPVCSASAPISLSPPKRSPSGLWGGLWDTVCSCCSCCGCCWSVFFFILGHKCGCLLCVFFFLLLLCCVLTRTRIRTTTTTCRKGGKEKGRGPRTTHFPLSFIQVPLATMATSLPFPSLIMLCRISYDLVSVFGHLSTNIHLNVHTLTPCPFLQRTLA